MEEKTERKDFKHIVRIVNTDLDGNKKVIMALQGIKGVSFMMANAVCKVTGINPNMRMGDLGEEQINQIQAVLKDPKGFGIPEWLFNRRRDLLTGQDMHIVGIDVDLKRKEDIDRLKMIRAYRGVRHMYGLPVRGQRTRSNFRKNKGKVIGVLKKAAKAAKKQAKK